MGAAALNFLFSAARISTAECRDGRGRSYAASHGRASDRQLALSSCSAMDLRDHAGRRLTTDPSREGLLADFRRHRKHADDVNIVNIESE